MDEVSIIGVDLAKQVFQLHGAAADGRVVFRRRVRRAKLLPFFSGQPACEVVMEACGSAHYWAREIGALGHRVRLIAPAYVKPFVKRQKNDAADAEAIVEAAQRPTMRFVAVKSAERQASAMVFKTRDLLVRQRTSLVNALRAHLAEFGLVAAKGMCHVGRLAAVLDDDATLPEPVRRLCGELIASIGELTARIDRLDREVKERARTDELARRLQTIPSAACWPRPFQGSDRRPPGLRWNWAGHGPGARGPGAAARDVRPWPRSRRLDRPDAAAAFERRGQPARQDLEDGPARPPASLDHRCQCRRSLGKTTGIGRSPGARGLLAGWHARAQAADAGDGGTGQQDSTHRLGLDGQRRCLPGSRSRCLNGRPAARLSRMGGERA